MPRGDKSKYTEKQKRKAEHIEEGYVDQGISRETAEQRAWATVNKTDGGGKQPGGSGRGKKKSATAKKSTKKSGGQKKGGTKKGTKKKGGKKGAKKKGAKKVGKASERRRNPNGSIFADVTKALPEI